MRLYKILHTYVYDKYKDISSNTPGILPLFYQHPRCLRDLSDDRIAREKHQYLKLLRVIYGNVKKITAMVCK